MAACVLGQVLATALWASLSSRALSAVRGADADVGDILGSTLTLTFSTYAVTTGVLLAAATTAAMAAAVAMRWRAHGGEPRSLASWGPGLPPHGSNWPADALSSPGSSASCTKPVACTAVNVIYVGLMLWACAAIAGYATWMSDTSSVVEGAELSLLRGAAAAARTAGNGGAVAALGSAARSLASVDELLVVGAASADGSGGAGQGVGAGGGGGEWAACAAECLDLRSWRFRFAHASTCVCDRATLQGLCDTGIALYDSLVATMTVLLLVYGSASMCLIYISALLARADGRSELEVVMEEGDRLTSPGPEAASYGGGREPLAADGVSGGGGGSGRESVFAASRQSAWLAMGSGASAAPAQSAWSQQGGGAAGGCEWRHARRLISGRFSGGGGSSGQQGLVLQPSSARHGRSGSCFDPHGGGLDGAGAHAAHDFYKRW